MGGAGNEAATYNDGQPGACANIDSPIPGLFLASYQGLGMRQP